MKNKIEDLERQLMHYKKSIALENNIELNDLKEELKYKTDLLNVRDKEIQDLRKEISKLKYDSMNTDKFSNLENLKEKINEYRNKYFAEKKKVDDLTRQKYDLDNKLEVLNREITTKTMKNNG